MSAIRDLKLWDSLGNYCRIELFKTGPNTFELYLHDFNDATPRRFVGPLGLMINKGDIWLAIKKEAGFCEQLPSYNPDHWKA